MRNVEMFFSGRIDGAPVICLHGIGGHASNFEQMTAHLGGYACWCVNLPGYGDSAPLNVPSDFEHLSYWLGQIISQLDRGAVHLVGHSIGGMIGLEHACRQPEQIASLSMLGATSAFGGKDDSFKKAFLEARLAPLDTGTTMQQMAEQAIDHLVGSSCDEAARIAGITSLAQVDEPVWRDILRCLVNFNRRDDIAAIKTPVCIIAGEEDTNAPARTLQKMAQTFLHAEFHCLKAAGHLLPLESPAEIGQIINRFISGQK
ncbi:MAG: alpha/beta fold hydrolase [Candidatus Puniceispirillaceae bacterium]|jgi:3-oxoadipate enol-lactonase